MAWSYTYYRVSQMLKLRNIQHKCFFNVIEINNEYVGCTTCIRKGTSITIKSSYDSSGVQNKYFFVIIRSEFSYSDMDILILLPCSFMKDYKSRSLNLLDMHQYALDIDETFFPKSINTIIGSMEMKSVDSLQVA